MAYHSRVLFRSSSITFGCDKLPCNLEGTGRVGHLFTLALRPRDKTSPQIPCLPPPRKPGKALSAPRVTAGMWSPSGPFQPIRRFLPPGGTPPYSRPAVGGVPTMQLLHKDLRGNHLTNSVGWCFISASKHD